MQPEIEAKYLSVDIEEVRSRLEKAGAKLKQPMRLMRRVLFDYPDSRFQKNGHTRRLRVRDEGNKVALNFKSKNESNYVDEIELNVESFDTSRELLKSIGLVEYSYQESRREAWEIDGVEVVIDEWPWLEPYIEIEGPTEESIKLVSDKLGFDWNDAKFGSVDTAYMAQYPKMTEEDSVGDLPEVKFAMEVPTYFRERE